MVETLQRFHVQAASESSGGESGSEDEASDEDDGVLGGLSDASLLRLAERDELRLEDLTAEEQRAFLRAVGSGSLRCVALSSSAPRSARVPLTRASAQSLAAGMGALVAARRCGGCAASRRHARSRGAGC